MSELNPYDIARAAFYAPIIFSEPRKYYIKDMSDLKVLADRIIKHGSRRGEYETLERYYKNNTKINTRLFEDPSKPNNRISHPFAEIIVNDATSYFTGEPIQVVPTKKERLKDLDYIHRVNDTDDVNSELDKLSNIYGHSFEVHWLDKQGDRVIPRYKALSPKNVMIFHSMEISEEPIGAIIWTQHKDEATKVDHFSVTVYTDKHIEKFRFTYGTEVSDIIPDGEKENHNRGALPVIEYLNNEDRSSSFEKVISLIDSYNVAISDTVNDVEYWADSYLVLTDMSGTSTEDIRESKRNRVMLMDGSGKAEFLQKNTNDRHLENIKDRFTSDIHKFSQVPNLSDESFANNLSGTAIRMKIKSLEDKISVKERKFDKALRKRYELIFHVKDIINLEKTDDFVEFIYTRNIPSNLVELGDMVAKAPEGLWSMKTLRTLFPIKYDESAEVAQIKKEQEEKVSNEMGANPFKANPQEPKPPNAPPAKPKVDPPPRNKPQK